MTTCVTHVTGVIYFADLALDTTLSTSDYAFKWDNVGYKKTSALTSLAVMILFTFLFFFNLGSMEDFFEVVIT